MHRKFSEGEGLSPYQEAYNSRFLQVFSPASRKLLNSPLFSIFTHMRYLQISLLLKLLMIPQVAYSIEYSCRDAEWIHVSFSGTTERMPELINAIITNIEGRMGAVVMLACGLLALLLAGWSAVGKLRRRCLLGSLVFLILAVGIFLVRSQLAVFFNDDCIVEGTLVDTPNGQVPVESLRVGSLVISIDDAGRAVASEVVALSQQFGPSALQFETESAGILRITHPHLVLTDVGWMPACSLRLGSRVLTTHGYERIVAASKIVETVRTFELSTSPVHNFIAGGVVVHNIKP